MAERTLASEPTRLGTGWEGPALFTMTVLLLSFGIVMVYSASAVMAQAESLPDYHFVLRQAIAGAVGLVLLGIASQIDYRVLSRLAWPLLLIVIGMLVVVVLPGTEAISPRINGARRWLGVGALNVQPSELAKLALINWTAMMAVRKQDKLSSLSRGLLPFLVVWAVVSLLIMLQPSLSALLIVLMLSALVVFAGGARIGHFLLLGVVGLPLIWGRIEGVAYRMGRIAAFLDPSQDVLGTRYQINQSLISFGSGGMLGRGFGRGEQKFGFLPEPHNDFLFAIIGEEWGFVGALAVVLAFTAFGLVGYRVARQAPDLFGQLLALGLTNLVAVQALLHMAINTALVPTTGVTLPFMSFGGSSLLVCLTAVGMLMSIARAGEEGLTGPSPRSGRRTVAFGRARSRGPGKKKSMPKRPLWEAA